MDGLTLIREARMAGLALAVDGDKLVIRGPKRAEAVARKLIDHKGDVMAALQPSGARLGPSTWAPIGDDSADWIEFYREREAMRQYEAGYSRAMAGRLAWGECVEAWCKRNPLHRRPSLCAGCGGPLGDDVLDLPDGARVHWERHREFTCLIVYGDQRKRRATEALAALGLRPPMGWGL